MAYAALAMLAFAIAIPAVLGSRGPLLGLSADAVLAAARDSYTLSTPVPLLRTGGLTLERGTVSLAATQSGPLRSGEAMLKMLLGSSSRLVLDDAAITFVAYTRPQTATVDNGALDQLSPLLTALLGARFEQLTVRNASIEIVRSNAPSRVLTSVNAAIKAKRNGTVIVSGSFDYLGETLKFDTSMSLGDRSSAVRIPIQGHIRGRLIDAAISEARVTIANGFELSSQNAAVAVPDLRKASRWLGSAWPDGPGLQSAKIVGTLDLVAQSLAFQRAKVELDGNEATGALLMNLGGERPGIEGTLALQILDVARYLPVAADAAGAGEQAQRKAQAGRGGPFLFPVLRHFDADLRLSANKVLAGPVTLGRSAAALTLRAGKLVADLAELEIDGQARGNAQISIDMSDAGPRFALRTRLDDIECEGVAGALLGRPLVRGRGVLALDLSGTGADIGPLVNSLTGKASLRLPRGGSIAIDVPALLAGAQSKPADEIWGTAVKGQTQVDELDAGFRIAQGVWTTESVTARSGNALLTGTGVLDAPAGEIDLVVTRTNAARPIDISGTPAGQGLSAHVRGQWTAPRIVPANRTRKPS